MPQIIPLDPSRHVRENWFILYSWILSPHNERLRNDIASYLYSRRLISQGKHPTTELAPSYKDVNDMFISMIHKHYYGLRYKIDANKFESIAAGGVIVILHSMVKYKVDEPSLAKARYVFIKTRTEKQLKWGFGNELYLQKAEKRRRDANPFCAALYYYFLTRKISTAVTAKGFARFIECVTFYNKFCTEFTYSRHHDSVDPYVIKPKDPLSISQDYPLPQESTFDSTIYTHEYLEEALKGFSPARDKKKFLEK